MTVLVRPFAVALSLAIGTLALVSILLWARAGFATPPYVFMSGPGGMLALLVAVSTQLVSGFVLAIRRPDLPIGPLALIFAFVVGSAMAACAYLAVVEAGLDVPWPPGWIAWFASWFGFAGGSLTAVILGLVFPDGRLPGRRWAFMVGLSIVGAVLTAAATALMPGRLVLFPAYDNPAALAPDLGAALTAVAVAGMGLLALGAAAVSITLVIRYRRADALLRVQLRWYIASAIALAVGFGAFLVALATLPPDSGLGELVMVLFIAAGALPPIALLIAISRYRLYDIDTILSRAFVFGTLTAILAGVYTASIRLFNSLFTAVTGESSDAALVITTLVLAASFTPIKRRLEAFVDRRFRPPEPVVAATAGGAPGDASPAGVSMAGSERVDGALVARIAAAVLADPAFTAALDERLAEALPPAPPSNAPGASDAEPARIGHRISEHD